MSVAFDRTRPVGLLAGSGRFPIVFAEKARRVRAGARAWLAAHPEVAGLEVEIEVVAIQGGRVERVPLT